MTEYIFKYLNQTLRHLSIGCLFKTENTCNQRWAVRKKAPQIANPQFCQFCLVQPMRNEALSLLHDLFLFLLRYTVRKNLEDNKLMPYFSLTNYDHRLCSLKLICATARFVSNLSSRN
jgi:hypothetical protein